MKISAIKLAKAKAQFISDFASVLGDIQDGKKRDEFMSLVFPEFTIDVEIHWRENCKGGWCGLLDDVGVTCQRHAPKGIKQ